MDEPVMSVALCDDEPAQTEYLSALVRKWSGQTGVTLRLSVFDSAESFLFWYEDNKPVALLLLDIQMRGMDGVALARKMRGENADTQIVFVTGYTEFMAQGYEVQALHYIMKPVKEDKLFEALERARKAAGQSARRSLLVQADGETHRIPFAEILYIEAQGHYVLVNTAARSLKTKAYITDMEKMLDEGFFRCQRSFIVNLQYVRKIMRTGILMEGGAEIPLSRGAYEAANQAVIKYF